MINFDLTTLIVAIAVIAFFSILGRKLTRWRESIFEKILIVGIMLLAGLISVVSVVSVWNTLVVPWLPQLPAPGPSEIWKIRPNLGGTELQLGTLVLHLDFR